MENRGPSTATKSLSELMKFSNSPKHTKKNKVKTKPRLMPGDVNQANKYLHRQKLNIPELVSRNTGVEVLLECIKRGPGVTKNESNVKRY